MHVVTSAAARRARAPTRRGDHRTVVLDKNPAVGALAITSHIANYPGVDKTMSGRELLDQMREQAIMYGTDYRRAQVFLVDVDSEDGVKTVYTPDAVFKAKALVLATGAMGRPPGFKGEDTYLGRGVSYCATCDGALYSDSEVAVVGVNQEAIEEAHFLTKFASTVHWITQKDPAEDDEDAQELLAEPNVRLWRETRMLSVEGDDSGVTGVMLKSRHEEEPQQLEAEGVFITWRARTHHRFHPDQKIEMKGDGGWRWTTRCAPRCPAASRLAIFATRRSSRSSSPLRTAASQRWPSIVTSRGARRSALIGFMSRPGDCRATVRRSRAMNCSLAAWRCAESNGSMIRIGQVSRSKHTKSPRRRSTQFHVLAMPHAPGVTKRCLCWWANPARWGLLSVHMAPTACARGFLRRSRADAGPRTCETHGEASRTLPGDARTAGRRARCATRTYASTLRSAMVWPSADRPSRPPRSSAAPSSRRRGSHKRTCPSRR